LGLGLVGKVAATGQQLILNGLNEKPGDSGELDCLVREQIRGFHGSPITFKGEVLGVLAAFTREDIPDEVRPWGLIFADHIGAAVANARAFEEIQRLKAQLEQQNAYLEEEVLEAKAFGDLVGQKRTIAAHRQPD
jgi:GAF domain-containing protein